MTHSFLLGAGPIGSELAAQLVAEGHRVTVGTRSGTQLPGTAAVHIDAADRDALVLALAGVTTLYLCTNPPYPEWEAQWPPILDAVLYACARTGTDLVITGNLYVYGPVVGPMREDTPLATAERKGLVRVRMWELARSAHERGDVRATEIRASDYFGSTATPNTHLGARFFEPILKSKRAWVVGSATTRHSWAYLPDFAAMLRAAGTGDAAWGRAWHAPHSSDASRAEIAREVNSIVGSHGRAVGTPIPLLRVIGLVSPDLREVSRLGYQFDRDFVVDSAASEAALDVRATPWGDALAATVDFYRSRH